MRRKSKPEILPHVDHLSSLLIQRQRSVEQYCGKQQVNFQMNYFMTIFI